MNTTGFASDTGTLTDDQVREIIASGVEQLAPAGQRILAVVPDHTRTCPLPLMARELHAALAAQGASVDFMIALGTHSELDEPAIDRLFGIEPGQREAVLPGSSIYNHEWQNPEALTTLGH